MFKVLSELWSNGKSDVAKHGEDLRLHGAVDVVVPQVRQQHLHHLVSERPHQLVAHGPADISDQPNSCVTDLILRHILQANEKERLQM